MVLLRDPMNIFFHQIHKYFIGLPKEQVQQKLKYVTTRRFDDFSIDIIGSLKDDGSFSLTNKFGISNTKLVENRLAYMRGNVVQNNEETVVEVNTRPNIILIILFYLTLLLFVIELFNLPLFGYASKGIRLSLLFIFSSALVMLMIYFTTQLKKRFERVMQLRG